MVAELGVFRKQGLVLCAALHHGGELAGIDGLVQIIIGSATQGLHGCFHISVTGNDHHVRFVCAVIRLDARQQLQTIHAGHTDVCNDQGKNSFCTV